MPNKYHYCFGFKLFSLCESGSVFKLATFREILLPSSGWWEKYLSKRGQLKHTCSWHDKLLYYEYWTDKQKYLYGSVYTYNFSVYEGKQNSSSEYRILHGIFIELMAPLLAPLLSSFYRQLVYCSSFSRIILVGRNELDWYHSFTQKIPTIRCEKEFS